MAKQHQEHPDTRNTYAPRTLCGREMPRSTAAELWSLDSCEACARAARARLEKRRAQGL